MKRRYRSFKEVDGNLIDHSGLMVKSYRRTKHSMRVAIEQDTIHVEINVVGKIFFVKSFADMFIFCSPDTGLHGEIDNTFSRNFEEPFLKHSILNGDFTKTKRSEEYLTVGIWNDLE